jgi:hypothetical protein
MRAILERLPDQGSPMPALIEAARNPAMARTRPAMPLIERDTRELLADVDRIPALTYTRYRDVQRETNRLHYQRPYREKRSKMGIAALQVLLGRDAYLNTLYDYIWSTCEETGWALPQVEHLGIELRVVATAMELAEIVEALGDKLEDRLIARIRQEIDERVFTPYLQHPETYFWYRGSNNWNGVCNGAIGVAFLLLEDDPDRLARALATVLAGLEAFLNTAFTADGGCEEGPGYWQYGLSNLICFSEALRQRTGGEIDLLATDRVREIAAYPTRVMLSPGHYFSYSDSNEETAFHSGYVQRLAERAGVEDLLGILAQPAPLRSGSGGFRAMWRALMWWDGTRPQGFEVADSLLPATEIVRLTGRTPDGVPVVLAAKAGHNGVSHNHNDVGAFALHVDGETFLCDPERGVYDQYKIHGRYNVPFAASYGHSVPRIDGIAQSAGREFAGQILNVDTGGEDKQVEMRIEGAYEVPALAELRRRLVVTPQGEVVLEDRAVFSGEPAPVEAAFVTFHPAMVSGPTALITGDSHILQLTVESPAGAHFALEVLREASAANNKPVPLKRLSVVIDPERDDLEIRVRARVLA